MLKRLTRFEDKCNSWNMMRSKRQSGNTEQGISNSSNTPSDFSAMTQTSTSDSVDCNKAATKLISVLLVVYCLTTSLALVVFVLRWVQFIQEEHISFIISIKIVFITPTLQPMVYLWLNLRLKIMILNKKRQSLSFAMCESLFQITRLGMKIGENEEF